jgi:hypothetical protein
MFWKNPFIHVGLVVAAISLSGLLAAAAVGTVLNPWVFGWLWFNLFIVVYEIYIVFYRRAHFDAEKCPRDFWKEPVGRDFWFKAWQEYTCFSDRRYLEAGDFVFWLEFGNVVIVALLAMAYVANSGRMMMVVLFVQAYHALIYFLTLYHSKKYSWMHPTKAVAYLFISAVWIIIPALCIRSLW